MRLRLQSAVVLGMVMVVGLTSCGGGGGREGARPVALDVTATEFEFDAPGSIAGGLVRIRLKNEGAENHEAQLVRLGQGRSTEDLVQAVDRMSEGGPIPEWLTFPGGVGELPPGTGASAAVSLEPGAYSLLCTVSGDDDKPHYAKGMLTSLTVTAQEASPPPMPETDATITAKEYSFDVPPLTSGVKRLTFRNVGPRQPHLLAVGVFDESVTLEQVRAAIDRITRDPSAEPDLPDTEAAGGFGALDPDRSGVFDLTLEAGRTYLMVCFLSDRSGGPPHLLQGMIEAFAVE